MTRRPGPGTSGGQLSPPEGMRITEMLPFVIQKASTATSNSMRKTIRTSS